MLVSTVDCIQTVEGIWHKWRDITGAFCMCWLHNHIYLMYAFILLYNLRNIDIYQFSPLMARIHRVNGFWSVLVGEVDGQGRNCFTKSALVAALGRRSRRLQLPYHRTLRPCLLDHPCRPMPRQRHSRDPSNQHQPFGQRRGGWAITTSSAKEK